MKAFCLIITCIGGVIAFALSIYWGYIYGGIGWALVAGFIPVCFMLLPFWVWFLTGIFSWVLFSLWLIWGFCAIYSSQDN